MRITGQTVVRRYLTSLERTFSRKNEAENKITSNRKYTRGSQSPLEAAKAMKVRKSIAELETHDANLKTAKSIYDAAETSVMKVSELIQSTYSQLIYGATGTINDDQDLIIAETIEKYADEMVQLLNVRVADRTIFGGTSNQGAPYSISNGTVYYNGVSVNEYQNPEQFPSSGTSYSDIGIGMRIGDDGRIDSQSALPVTFNGADVMGCGLMGKKITIDFDAMVAGDIYRFDVSANGVDKVITFTAGGDGEDTAANMNEALEEAFGYKNVSVTPEGLVVNHVAGDYDINFSNRPLLDEDHDDYYEYDQAKITTTPTGYSNNIIQLTLDAAACLKSHDKLGAAKYADALYAIQTNLSLTIADIGNTEEFIDFNQERVTNNLYSMYDLQNDLEHTDLGTEITNWKVLESLFSANLQMSASVVPMTIFNFIN